MTGSGTLADPYIIYNVTDLQAMENDLTAYYELANDIDASATSGWNAGLGFDPIDPSFSGHFDGRGFTITSLTINRPLEGNVGLFGNTAIGGCTIINVGLVSVDITGDNNVGALVGSCSRGTITACYSTGQVAGDNNTGGLIGTNAFGSIISRCFSTATITGTGGAPNNLGGFIGSCSGSTISDCYARGDVTGVIAAGGNIGGFIGSSFVDTIDNCYSTGAPTGGAANVGGLIGSEFAGTVTNCFWDTETSGQATSDGGTGKTTAEMTTETTFTGAGWDLAAIWGMFGHCNDVYPCLRGVTSVCNALLPTVPTNAASEVGQELAALNLTLDDDGGEVCECGFEWGRTTDYGSTTATANKETGETFSQEISGLTPNTEYHFRAFATNSAGTSYGDDVMFTTQQRPLVNYRPIVNRSYALSRHEV